MRIMVERWMMQKSIKWWYLIKMKIKAPVQYGYNAKYFQSFWSIIGKDVPFAIKDLFKVGLLKEINNIFLTLVSKAPKASSMSDCRPISCYNILYEIILNIMAIQCGN